MTLHGFPPAQGLYDPQFEHDSCGFGFVVDIKGRKSRDIVQKALTVLLNLEHRGAQGAEKNTGDGAGLLVQLPHRFFEKALAGQGVKLPAPGSYGVGMIFMPRHEASRAACCKIVREVIEQERQRLLCWREVPTDGAGLGSMAQASQPHIMQVFIGRGDNCATEDAFERKLYVIRRLVEKAVARSAIPQRGQFYVPSMSYRTVVYKGMLNASQLRTFYPEVNDPTFETAIGMVHSRFSTNTFPSW
ncbi:MAG TPA: glutamate synthase subunit alpha, partial [Anaeromyxobacteraceae bacterium]|nr:glutamate synthase subunit alpha [Anaeromyxobacteraceae bacterium]